MTTRSGIAVRPHEVQATAGRVEDLAASVDGTRAVAELLDRAAEFSARGGPASAQALRSVADALCGAQDGLAEEGRRHADSMRGRARHLREADEAVALGIADAARGGG